MRKRRKNTRPSNDKEKVSTLHKVLIVAMSSIAIAYMVSSDRNMINKMLKPPIDFSRVKEGLRFEVMSQTVHVFLKVYFEDDSFFTVGITTLDDFQIRKTNPNYIVVQPDDDPNWMNDPKNASYIGSGMVSPMFLTAPDYITVWIDNIDPIATNINGRLSRAQAGQLRNYFLNSFIHSDQRTQSKFHVKMFDKNFYNMLGPDQIRDTRVLPEYVNCGTFITFFLANGDHDKEELMTTPYWIRHLKTIIPGFKC